MKTCALIIDAVHDDDAPGTGIGLGDLKGLAQKGLGSLAGTAPTTAKAKYQGGDARIEAFRDPISRYDADARPPIDEGCTPIVVLKRVDAAARGTGSRWASLVRASGPPTCPRSPCSARSSAVRFF